MYEADVVPQIIPEIGLESAPADVVTWALASLIREQLSVGTRETIMSIHEMKYGPTNKLTTYSNLLLDLHQVVGH